MANQKDIRKIEAITWELLHYSPSKLEENGLSPINLVGANLKCREIIKENENDQEK